MKDAILLKIKDIAMELLPTGAVFSSADLADELSHLGVDGDSFNICSLVWEAFNKYDCDNAIKQVFVNNAHTKSLIEEYQLWNSLNNKNNEKALSILQCQKQATQEALTILNDMLDVPQSQSKQKGIMALIEKLSGVMGIKNVQHEAELLFTQYSRMINAYNDAQVEVKSSVSAFMELREYLAEQYRQYAMMLVDVFGDKIKVSFPELFDFEAIKYLDTQVMLDSVELEYSQLASQCSEMLADVSDSFKLSLQGAVVAYSGNKGNKSNQSALVVAAMNMMSHYIDSTHKTTMLKRSLQEMKNAANRDTAVVVGDIGRLTLIHQNINEVIIPKAELFFRYGEELLSEDFNYICKLLYGNEKIGRLKNKRDEMLAHLKELEQELKYEQTNINYYVELIAESESILKGMKKNYDRALKNKPTKPLKIKHIITFGNATKAYNRDICEWQQMSYPLIEKYVGLQVDLRIAQEEQKKLQSNYSKHQAEYQLLQNEVEAVAVEIKKTILVDENLKHEMLSYLKPMILLLKVAKDIIGYQIDSTLVEPVTFEEYKTQLLSVKTIDRINDIYNSLKKNTDNASVNSSKMSSQSDYVKQCIPIIEEYVKLNLLKEEGKMSEEFYKDEFERLRDMFAPIITNTDNQIETLREAIKGINMAVDSEELKQSIAKLASIDMEHLNSADWNEFLSGKNTIDI